MLNKDKTINKEEQQILLEKVHTKTLEVMELIFFKSCEIFESIFLIEISTFA
jgi:hypothetical protein